jgi:hypothetical protein
VVSRVPPAPLVETVDRIAQQNQISPRLVHSVIRAESNYDPNAVSPKGAQGLMQLIPATARRFGVSDVFDPADNIQGGARYLKYLLGLYKGDESLALAAYNALRRHSPVSGDAELRGQGAGGAGGFACQARRFRSAHYRTARYRAARYRAAHVSKRPPNLQPDSRSEGR